MTTTILQDDFITPGVLPSPAPWQTISGSGFRSDGSKAFPLTASGNECQSTLVQTFTPSNPTPWTLEYELDIITPTAWPPNAGNNWLQGMSFLQASTGRNGLTLVIGRATSGPSSFWRFTIRANAAANDVQLSSGTLPALSFGQIVRLATRVTFASGSIQVEGRIDSTLLFITTITLAQFNLVTGRIGSDFQLVAKLMGLFADVDGTFTLDANNLPVAPSVLGYFDRLRLRDIGTGAVQVDPFPEPTLTAFPSLTPIAFGDEDDSTGDTLTVQPDRPSIPADQFVTLETVYDSGHVQSTATQSRRRTRWPMTWGRVTETDRNTIVALHAAVTGRKKAFSWTDPETGTTYKLKFVAPMQSRQIDRGGVAGVRLFSLSTEVQEVTS